MARPTRKMMIIAAAVVAVAAVGGGATYLATTPTALSSSSEAAPAEGKVMHDKPGRSEKAKTRKAERAGGAAGGMLGKIEHGEFTTASAGVMQVQRGAITAIDAGSVTVRSTDGFTASYTITPTTTVGKAGKGRQASAVAPVPGAPTPNAPAAGSAPGAGPGAPSVTTVTQLKTGDTVQVMATKTDAGSTATRIAPTRT